MKSILFINRVYPPVSGATGQLLAELAPELARSGWRVTVLTAAPPSSGPRSEQLDGVNVQRVSGLPFVRTSHWRRALSYLSLYPALLWRAWRLPRHDVVVTVTDPPLLAVIGWWVTLVRGGRAVHWAQDLYPELAEELGVLRRDGWIATVLRWLSTQALRRCHTVIAVGRCMRERLVRRNLGRARIEVIGNWGHDAGSALTGDRRNNPFRHAHQLGDRFVVMYSGNFGLAHPFEVIVDAIALMQRTHPQMLFLLVGDGPRLEWVKQQVGARALTNVRFLPFQPKERLAESLGAADLHLATMEENLWGLVVPSKVSGVLAAGRPCLFLGPADSEAARLIREHEFGEVLTGPSGEKLAGALTDWMEQPERLERVRERASTVASVVGRPAAMTAFARVFQRALETGRPSGVSHAAEQAFEVSWKSERASEQPRPSGALTK